MRGTAFLLIWFVCWLAQGTQAQQEATAPATFTVAATSQEQQAERDLLALVNEERRQHGLSELAADHLLRFAARQHAGRMAEAGKLVHDLEGEPPLALRVAETGLRFDRVAENISSADNVFSAHAGFMASSGHRANILNPEHSALGVGVIQRKGQLWIVEDFARRLPQYTAAEAEKILAAHVQELRRQKRLGALRRVEDTDLRKAACAMARTENRKPDLSPARVSRQVMTFMLPDPAHPPEALRQTAGERDLEYFSLGACFERTQEQPAGMYWVVMAFYY